MNLRKDHSQILSLRTFLWKVAFSVHILISLYLFRTSLALKILDVHVT